MLAVTRASRACLGGASGWTGVGGSRFLEELSAGGAPERLSIRFNVDGYQGVPSLLGRVVGSIGPYLPGEPRSFVAGRALRPVSTDYSPAYAQIDGETLT